MNTRVKEIRKLLGLSQEEFAKRLGITAAGISRIESGKRNLTEQMLVHICKEFNINESWLRFGHGECFTRCKPDSLEDLARQYRLDELDLRIINEYILLDESKRRVIKEYIMRIADYNPQPNYLTDGELSNELLNCAENTNVKEVK